MYQFICGAARDYVLERKREKISAPTGAWKRNQPTNPTNEPTKLRDGPEGL